MKAQFLLCEVQRLGQVLELFGARDMSRMQDEGKAKTPRRLPIPAVHQFLTASLNQLTTVMKEYCVSWPSTAFSQLRAGNVPFMFC
jgi:hypothetical protein